MLGIDPDPAKLWPAAIDRTSEARARLALYASPTRRRPAGEQPPSAGVVARLETAAAVLAHCRALIDAVGAGRASPSSPSSPASSASARPAGSRWSTSATYAREQGLLVLADGKRGDVPVTAAAYGQALVGSTPSPFGAVAGLGADAFTANPLLGRDALEPLVNAAREHAGRRVRARPHLQPGRGRPARPQARHRRAPVGAARAARRRARSSGPGGPEGRRRGHRRHRARSTSRACAS